MSGRMGMMTAVLALSTVAFAQVGGSGTAGPGTTSKAQLEQQVRDQTRKYEQAWNQQDVQGMASQYTNDATMLMLDGTQAQGKQQITQTIRKDFGQGGDLQGSRVSLTVEGVQMIAPDMALIDLRQTITPVRMQPGTGGAAPQQLHNVIVAVKQGEVWKIKALRILPAPRAQQPGTGGAGMEGQPPQNGTEGPLMPPPMGPERASPSDQVPNGQPPAQNQGKGQDTYLP